jgi:predicted acylesterase/phospholipase RssA
MTLSSVFISSSIIGLAWQAKAQTQSVCRVLVMSGGANKGAYEAGVIHGLSHLLNGTDAYYDVVSGVSAGSLNSAAMAMWAPNQAKAMSDWLVQFWKTVTGDMIFQEWPGAL